MANKKSPEEPKRSKARRKLSVSFLSDEGVGDLSTSLSPSRSLLPDIPPNLARPRHPLNKVRLMVAILPVI